MKRGSFQLTKTRAWLVGLLVAAVGVAAIIAADKWMDGTFEAATKNIGATVFSIGLVTIAYDVFIRKSYTDELLEIVGLSSHLSSSGIRRIEQETGLDWASVLDGGSNYVLLLVDGAVFAEREWPRILESSRKHKARVRVYTLDPRSEVVPHMARHLDQDPEEFANTLRRTQTTLENSWASARHSDPPLHSDSKLEIYTYDFAVPYTVIFVDETAIVSLTPAIGKKPGQGPVALRFDLRAGDAVAHWLEAQRRQLPEAVEAPVYSEPPGTKAD